MIFSKIELLFFMLGVFTTLSTVAIVYYYKRFRFSWKISILLGFSAFIALFALAWSGSSFIEGESQAARVGALLFGLPALMGFFMARKRILNTNNNQQNV